MTRNTSIILFHPGSILFVLLLTGLAGCTKLVEVQAPETNPAAATVYTSDATAAAVLTSIYGRMGINSFAEGSTSISVYAGLSADELYMPPPIAGLSTTPHRGAYLNSPTMNMPVVWRELYQNIYVANAAIEGIAKSQGGMTDSMKRQLAGEARFMRAFLHFYALNLYGNVPYIDTTDQWINARVTRNTKDEVYSRIIDDLVIAKDLLSENYKLPTGAFTTADRARPNKWAAIAMLARVYLYKGDWARAEAEASLVIAQTARFSLATDLKKMVEKLSKEVIWHIQPAELGKGTADANVLYQPAQFLPFSPVALRPGFINIFEANDKRRADWIDSMTVGAVKYYCPAKYRVKVIAQPPAGSGAGITVSPEFSVVLRLAEVLLIRAEAYAKQDKITEAQNDLNAIRTRAGLGATPAADQTSLLAAIEKERQAELFTEWGHRWLDLKRTNRINEVMTAVMPGKGAGLSWDPNMALYPIPPSEIDKNPNLAPQNPGYN